ncbi:MAG: hypothetical protein L0229_02455 [Blastocatellia bacterium]|nr:hypothetical protein [Blastocatellia bacterium]
MAKSKTKTQASKAKAGKKTAAPKQAANPRTKKAGKKTAAPKQAAKPRTKTANIGTAETSPRSKAAAPVSSDIRHVYRDSLLGRYLDKQRSAPAVKPRK